MSTSTPITITGSVTDISAGAPQEAVAANFPNGLPCVSDASMPQFMEAVYEQQPMPTNITGVPVTISVRLQRQLPNNGTTTTNAQAVSLAILDTRHHRQLHGNATFAGSQSYMDLMLTHLLASSLQHRPRQQQRHSA